MAGIFLLFWEIYSSALSLGIVTATIASISIKDKYAILRTIIVAAITLTLTDILLITTNGAGFYHFYGSTSFFVNIFSNTEQN